MSLGYELVVGAVQTAGFGLNLVALIAYGGVVVSFLTSPFIVVGGLFGYFPDLWHDPSDQARLCRVFHCVTTAIVIGGLYLWWQWS
jgi:hypothetical protein